MSIHLDEAERAGARFPVNRLYQAVRNPIIGSLAPANIWMISCRPICNRKHCNGWSRFVSSRKGICFGSTYAADSLFTNGQMTGRRAKSLGL